ncbi:hypothetical protein BJY04DRAFT_222957 [Aspergillus karnatakaensis]|uniref:uncharacterized protein n=1 Tax=Aspergillus karnatakaensis TaxID=1810916 RepID=UPI003CCCFEE8
MTNHTLLHKKHNSAIAQLIVFSAIHVVQFILRLIQERRYWHHTRRRSNVWCFAYSWWGMIGIIAQLRAADAAIMMPIRYLSMPVLITRTILQGLGLTFLLFEVSLILLRSGQAGRTGPGNSRHPAHLRFTLHFFRFPAFISMVMALVGGVLNVRSCEILGAIGRIVFAFTIILVWYIVLGMVARSRKFLSAAGYQAVLVVLASLPFFTVRAAIFLLGDFQTRKVRHDVGDAGLRVAMELLLEVIVAGLLIVARVVAEPLFAPLPEITLD